jgi:hypothetical protein
MVVALTTTTLVAATPPKVTVQLSEKPVPVMVTDVPPPVLPVLGLHEVGLGVARLMVTLA